MSNTQVIMKGSKTILATGLSSDEMDCNCTNPRCHYTLVNDELLERWNKLRTGMAQPLKINSAYRCMAHNESEGGVADSRHTLGRALDVSFEGVDQAKLTDFAARCFPFIKIYSTFVHVDIRSL